MGTVFFGVIGIWVFVKVFDKTYKYAEKYFNDKNAKQIPIKIWEE